MPTERQSESARINGAKSRGPKSAEGKKKSSRNSLQHGCTASHTIILACEDPKDFERMVEKYDTMYKPVTLEEQDGRGKTRVSSRSSRGSMPLFGAGRLLTRIIRAKITWRRRMWHALICSITRHTIEGSPRDAESDAGGPSIARLAPHYQSLVHQESRGQSSIHPQPLVFR